MSLTRGWRWLSALLLAGLAATAWSDTARADGGSCPAGGCATGTCATGNCGSWFSCCPKYHFTIEKPPKICFKKVCSKPLCDLCDIEGNGYFPTCWRPWAYPPNYSHCPVPPPGVLASLPPPLIGDAPAMMPEAPPGPSDPLPAPRKTANPNPDR
jgi:hypothetical protein